MDLKLELLLLPVSDVEASLAFYRDQVGFVLDHDIEPGNGMRIIQLTPPGSSCSIGFGVGIGDDSVPPGSVRGTHLVVDDVALARQSILDRGVAVSDVQDMGGVKYAYFADPDGNSWALQEIGSRTPAS
jgi:catechol 2,3-dioxygenase-like lactoylglutathione lyase family enzyme